ncbi:Na(+)/H(+) antiporter subunit B [Oceanobacillus alkalisoli]|uniref:Na(+)/H(+) antiporter subunit B n=1 Tax=Oceanobacillus alkalisoli TaxID=2925113 RepID=UPI001EEFF638|nr:Na(+)/H(+) antiporter subunit B [Oceanobacillus alkalisoli]MCF3943552.1 Na(+)/H(+) antiporter subunit B [Oceanobacillus alkalisoli]MCG5102817.1 Na(+)/H(+) antiporter subunit B [Oceanobacillus alkalisoli]
MKINNVILRTVTKISVFIILTLAVYLFFAGHNSPGGGFIAGLVLAAAFVLLFLVYDMDTIRKGIPIDFKKIAAFGAFLAVGTGFGAFVFDVPFLTQSFDYFEVPFFGEVELSTVTIFEAGVSFAVVGVVITIILSISEDV